jgi:hypothetical protein
METEAEKFSIRYGIPRFCGILDQSVPVLSKMKSKHVDRVPR